MGLTRVGLESADCTSLTTGLSAGSSKGSNSTIGTYGGSGLVVSGSWLTGFACLLTWQVLVLACSTSRAGTCACSGCKVTWVAVVTGCGAGGVVGGAGSAGLTAALPSSTLKGTLRTGAAGG